MKLFVSTLLVALSWQSAAVGSGKAGDNRRSGGVQQTGS